MATFSKSWDELDDDSKFVYEAPIGQCATTSPCCPLTLLAGPGEILSVMGMFRQLRVQQYDSI